MSETASLDASLLTAHILEKPRSWILAHPEASIPPAQQAELELKLQKLESGLPLPYLLGEWEFFGLKFKVTPDTLIPRPETELLIETALAWVSEEFLPQRTPSVREEREEKDIKKTSPPSRDLRALRGEPPPDLIHAVDVGTGTGCIAVSLAVHCPNLHIVATDLSPAALAVAQHNAARHHVADRITLLEADLLNTSSLIDNYPIGNYPLEINNYQLITANLPYIPTSTLHTLDVYGREPTLALDGGPDGLTHIRRLLSQAATRLAPGGLMLLEIEATQGQPVRALAHPHFPDARIIIRTDLAGHDRLLIIQTSSN